MIAGDEDENRDENEVEVEGVGPSSPSSPTGSDLGPVGEGFRSGFVSVVGLPNVGKSTLINGFLERSVLITSFRPQTTRNQIRCIVTDGRRQIVFVDTPGFVAGKFKMDRLLRKEIYRGKADVDVLLYVVDATDLQWERNRNCWKALTRDVKGTRIVVLNKIDRFAQDALLPIAKRIWDQFGPDELVPTSALKGKNLETLDLVMTSRLPEGPQYFPGDQETDRPLEFVLSEFVREQLYLKTREEIPFACAVMVEGLKETEKNVTLTAAIIVERESQKGILIGADGERIDRIRRDARSRIEEFVQPRKARLEVTVRVKKNWRSSPSTLLLLTGMEG